MHGPVRNGVLADIVQVDPHVHALIPLTIIRWLTRLKAGPPHRKWSKMTASEVAYTSGYKKSEKS